jgi:hypothetical protein
MVAPYLSKSPQLVRFTTAFGARCERGVDVFPVCRRANVFLPRL